MAYGFEAKNDDGKVIINDTIENLHFLGKATRGSGASAYGDFPTYSGAYDTLDGRVIHTYTITCTSTPVVFIKPADYARWHAIIKQSVSSTTWTFEVMISGTSTSNPPELYCFINADDIPVPSGETYGMIVFKSDGTSKTFDSRRQPLAIKGGDYGAVPPTDPTNSSGLPGVTNNAAWNSATLDHDFRSSGQYNTISDSNVNTTNTMFSCSSLAQAVYSRVINGYKVSSGYPNDQEHWSTAWWWVMYRAAFRLRNNNFDAGWTSYEAGYWFDSRWDSGGWFNGGSGGYTEGNRPYDNKTINLQSNAYIIADSSGYD